MQKSKLDTRSEVAEYVMLSSQLASSLEVSGWPKPGNVHRTADFADTRFEHFLVGAVAIGPAMGRAASRGWAAAKGEVDLSEIGLGSTVKEAIYSVKKWHGARNTHLGICLLFAPLAAAAGKTYAETLEMSPRPLRRNVRAVIQSTTPRDAVDAYNAILAVSSRRELGELTSREAPDLLDAQAGHQLISGNVTLLEAMTTASSWDNIALEWKTGMRISFETGYPTLIRELQDTSDINAATVHTYLTLLAEFPDTFVARKIGLKEVSEVERAVEIGKQKTKWISDEARSILKIGGLTTGEGRKALNELDQKLRAAEGALNPGTTADLTASSLLIGILSGLRF